MDAGTNGSANTWLALGTALFWLCLPARAASLDINVATAYAPDNFQTQNLQQYANDVARATGANNAIAGKARSYNPGVLRKS